jgi:hypothetical protein
LKRVEHVDTSASTTGGGRIPWQSFGVGMASAGAPIGIGVLHPSIGAAMIIIELTLALTVIGTALFGSRELSERAFRLLRWIGNRPEPPSPGKTERATGDP